MSQKCVHQGCGKTYTDPDEVCRYHPGPPIFHEGQKGWKCCKPRVLTFEEFMAIPPCTDGKHSTTDLPPKIEKKAAPSDAAALSASASPSSASKSATPTPTPGRVPIAPQTAPTPPAEESDADDPALAIPDGRVCRRLGCGAAYAAGQSRDGEQCVHHPGVPLFHEGSKGYTCCRRRVLEFDQFLKLEGCTTKDRHLFVGSGKKKAAGGAGGKANGGEGGEEVVETVRQDFYQTPAAVIASFFLKKINKEMAKVEFRPQQIILDLPTTDNPVRRYKAEVPLYGPIDPAKSKYNILGTKLEVTLAKADGASWPVLRSDDRLTGEIIQIGRAGRA